MKLGFVYAGQGAQVVGMGKELYETYPQVKDIFDNFQLDFDYKTLCFEGPEETLSQTQFTQPCMVAVALGITRVLKDKGIVPQMVAGLSLGEYSALACSGVFGEQEVLELVRFRGLEMEKAVQGLESKMVAVLGLDRTVLEDIITKVQKETTSIVVISNYNCPGQLVVGGQQEGVDKVSQLASEAGAKRVIELNVSGPFHTPLMEQAYLALKEKFEITQFHTMNTPVVFNLTGKTLQENQEVKDLLAKQVKMPVRFEDSIAFMIENGIDTFVEIGPGKVLSGFIKKISKDVKLYQVEDNKGLEKLLSALEGNE